MTTQQALRQIEITLPDSLYQWLSGEAQHRDQDISAIVQAALERQARDFDLTQTRTWQLCGAFAVAEPEPAYVVGAGEPGAPTTNYAGHVNDVLYTGN
jgi:post-segregation antitoxin (ccd killing protein)